MEAELEIGKYYVINYVDPNYPCKCSCHAGGKRHVRQCCTNRSYNGAGLYLGPKHGMHLFMVPFRTLILHKTSVIEEMP